jgi:hypothetical protein
MPRAKRWESYFRNARLGSPYISGRTRQWLKFKNPAAPAVKREAEEDWGRGVNLTAARARQNNA